MNKYEIVKFIDEGVKLDVKVSPFENTIWLNIEQIALLFNRDRSVISKHIKNIFLEGELSESSVCAFFAHTANDEKIYNVKYYNLDVIISVGYRVKSKKGVLFRQWANAVLKEYLLKGYAIDEDRTLVTNENYIRLINKVESLDERVSNIERTNKEAESNNSKLFFDGEFYDAYSFIQNLFELANKEIIIIDNYIDRRVIDRLVVKKNNVKIIIYTNKNTKLIESDIESFNNQYGDLEVKFINNVHDRFIIIDRIKLYHLGHSIKDVGKKIFSINELNNKLIQVLLSNI